MEQLLATKFHIPSIRKKLVSRPRLTEQLNDGLHRKLTLISAPAGFGKTTLVGEWIGDLRKDQNNESRRFVAWISLDEGDNDTARFMSYFITAMIQVGGIDDTFGNGLLSTLQSPQPLPTDTIITSLINELAGNGDKIILVLDDYHSIEAQPVHDSLTFFLKNQPSNIHLVIVTREDPQSPLARLRVRGQMTELRAVDLQFTPSETAEFLNQVMGLDLSAKDIAALEKRTEGWIAGLQLAAISMQGQKDHTSFIKSFTGSHRLVLDYLIEEVLDQQPEDIQTFLLKTAILDRLTGSLCDALTGWDSGQQILEYLERANLFIIPLDNERRWYRYHHLFVGLLRQRLHQRDAASSGDAKMRVADLHSQASEWYKDNGMMIEAFHHAVAGNDIEQATHLVEENKLPLHLSSVLIDIIHWLESLPTTILNARPSLWIKYARMLLASGQNIGVEEKLQAAEKALQGDISNSETRNLLGHIAANRATIAVSKYQVETIIEEAQRALEYLSPTEMEYRGATGWKLGWAYLVKGDRAASRKAYTEAIAISKESGNVYNLRLAILGLGKLQEGDNQLLQAAESYQHALDLYGDQPPPSATEAHIGLARIFYQWNDLDAAQQYALQSIELAKQYGSNIDRYVVCEVFLARIKLGQGDVAEASDILAKTEQSVLQNNFVLRIPEVAAAQVRLLLHQGDLASAANLAKTHNLPISQARVFMAQGNPSAAQALLGPYRQQMEAKGWLDEQLKVIVLQAIASYVQGEKDRAAQLLGNALVLAEPGGFIRIFVDEGPPMAALLKIVKADSKRLKEYINNILTAFDEKAFHFTSPQPLIEPLSERELEVLQLIADGLTNPEIASKLYLTLNTVKVHSRNIYSKLGVNNRTEAGNRARELGILPSA